MEKVISKLSNEELDLVVGGAKASFKKGFLGTYTGFDGGEVSFKGVLGKLTAFAIPTFLVSAVVGVIEYFAISKNK